MKTGIKSSASSNFPAIAPKKSRQTSDSFRKRLHAFLTYFKRQNDFTPSNAITDVILAVATDVS